MAPDSPPAVLAATVDPVAAPPLPWPTIAALSLAAMASGLSMRVADPMLPRLAREFGVPLGEAAQVVTVFAVAYGLSQLLFGPLGDRFGKLRVIVWACAASAAAALACALAPGQGALLAARLGAGVAAAAVIPLAMAWIGDAVPFERRQPVLARFLIGQISGFALGVWLGGWAADHWDWRTPFWLIAGGFAAVGLVLHAVRRRGAHAVNAPAAGRAPGSALRRLVGEFAAVLARPWARAVLATVLAEGAVVYGPFAFVTAHLHQRHGLPLAQAGALVMGFAAGGLVFALGAQALVRRLGVVQLVHGGAALMAAALATVAHAGDWRWAVPACMVLGLGFYMLHNTLQNQATQMAPERRGAAVAAFAACFFLGQSLGVAVAGALVGPLGTGGVLSLGALGVLAVGWGFGRLRRRVAQPGATG